MKNDSHTTLDHLTHAYEKMMERVGTLLEQAENDALPALRQTIAHAKDKAVELGELSREEAEKIGEYLIRDVQDAARYLADNEGDLGDWLQFDLQLIEQRLWDLFSRAADRTRLELQQLEADALALGEYHTGEVTGPGTLICSECSKTVHFHAPGRIPPCPKCHGTVFRRAIGGD
jgi:polyhydroxyalkanoate synthesis regulator phasin